MLFLTFYVPLSKYIKPAIISLLLPPLKLCQGISSNATDFLKFQNLLEEKKKLSVKINELTAQTVQLQEVLSENRRLRSLLSLPQRKTQQTCAALLVGKDSSNWTKTVLLNKGKLSGIKKDMPVVLGAGLVGKVTEVGPSLSKVTLILDFNSKIPAKILRTREEGIVFGSTDRAGRSVCKIKYIQGEIKIGDRVISSGLGGTYPKGILIGKVVVVEEEKDLLYKVAEVHPVVEFSTLEEVMVITGK